MAFVTLMLAPFILVVSVGLVFVGMVVRHAGRSGIGSGEALGGSGEEDGRSAGGTGEAEWLAGASVSWLAVRGSCEGRVRGWMAEWGTWRGRGVGGADGCRVVRSCMSGWYAVIGAGYPLPDEDVDRCYCFMTGLSRECGEVQMFRRDRLTGVHAWIWARSGRIVRGYAWAGDVVWREGRETWAERELGLQCPDYFEGDVAGDPARWETMRRNADQVDRLAALWGMDPARVQAGEERGGGGQG
jgi:hypothetical protein